MLVFLHGMWCNSNVWHNFIEYFKARNYTCEAIDIKKGLDLKQATFMDYVNKVDSIVGKDDVLIGHSMGGLIVQKMAEKKKIKGGVAICTAPPKGVGFRNFSLTLHSLKFLPKIIAGKPFMPSRSFVKKFIANCIDETKIDKVVERMEVDSPHVAYELAMAKISVDERKIQSPLLFIATREDRISSPEIVKKIAEKYNAEFIVKEGCHWIFDEWEEIAEEIAKFLVRIYE